MQQRSEALEPPIALGGWRSPHRSLLDRDARHRSIWVADDTSMADGSTTAKKPS